MPGGRGYFRCIRTNKVRPDWKVRGAHEWLMESLRGDYARVWPTAQKKRGKQKIKGKGKKGHENISIYSNLNNDSLLTHPVREEKTKQNKMIKRMSHSKMRR